MKSYIAVVQCHIVKERCSGFLCEKSFHDRTGKFEAYSKDDEVRFLNLTCGGCCGRGVHRKLADLKQMLEKKEKLDKSRLAVHLSSCIAFSSYHGPACPHLDYLKDIITNKLGLDCVDGTYISKAAQRRREKGIY